MAVSGALAERTVPPTPQPTSFRQDIQGLRAVAGGLVVAGHAGASAVGGGFIGVDVFFVISGFLITGLLLKDAAQGRINFLKFYTRRALRILPAATVVILATGLASLVVLNYYRAEEVLADSLWASLFAANIKFGRDGADYFSDAAVSPLQHFWSLAVEEQFYLVWPAVLALIVTAAVRVHRRRSGADRQDGPVVPRGAIIALLAAAGVASLWYSVVFTEAEPNAAYFSTFARAWELVAGALLAACLPWLSRLPNAVRTALTWAGVAGIVAAAVRYDETVPFPGSAALLPVLATCAVLAGGIGAPRFGANRVLAVQPFRFIGDISYSLYLWHWPVLILGAEWAGRPVGGMLGVQLVALALALSVLSYHLVENPLRRSRKIWGGRPARPLLTWPVAVGSVGILVLVAGWTTAPANVGNGVVAADSRPGVAEVTAAVDAADAGAPIPSNLDPTIEVIRDDRPMLGDCSGYHKASSEICQYGDPAGTRKIVVFGNSHSTAWVPTISGVAEEAGWQFLPVVKEGCSFPLLMRVGNQCNDWYVWAKDQLARLKPDVIVMNVFGTGAWQPDMITAIHDLKPLTGRLVLFGDVPGLPVAPFDCLQQSDATLGTCTFPVSAKKISDQDSAKRIATSEHIEFIDVRPWFCADDRCPSVIGNRIVYADIQHISQTYSRHLIPLLGRALKLE